jgi:segregation and condensation protein B
MSLKAKLEAVIYAADEPVTLGQLAVLFADEALEWKAEQEAALAEAQAEREQSEAAPLLEGVPPVEELSAAELSAAGSSVVESMAPTAEIVAEGEAEAPAEDAEAVRPAAESEPDRTAETVAAEAAATETKAAEEVAAEQEPAPTTAAEAEAEAGETETRTETGEVADGQTDVAEGSAETAEGEEHAEAVESEEAAAKRLARQRDREVKAVLRKLLDELVADYVSDNRGVEIREIAGGYRMATKPECHDAVRGFVKSLKPTLKLSLPALETLAVIAYKQPVTAPEVNEIRGVDSSGVFGSLLARKLIATAGRKQVIGRPILYKTTKEFLLRFGLKDVNELPSMEEFEKMAASELDEPETAPNTAPSAVQIAEADTTTGETPAAAPDPEAPNTTDNPAPEDAPAELPPAE